jgi:hypothetical protein
MGAMASGDRAAVFTLLEEFGAELARAVRSAARGLNVDLHPAEIRELTIDVALEMFALAGSWDPSGGALPWVWAQARVRSIVSGFVGQHADPFEERHDGPAPASATCFDIDDEAVLRGLAELVPQCAVLLKAMELVMRDRDRRVVLSYRVQQALGDPSPARTIGEQHCLSPDNVRQIVRRAKVALLKLAQADPAFAGLTELGWLR